MVIDGVRLQVALAAMCARERRRETRVVASGMGGCFVLTVAQDDASNERQ